MFRPQALVEERGVVGDEGVGRGEDATRGAVILLELDHLQLGVVLLQQLQVLDIGAAPGIDRLIVVAHRGERAAHAREQLEQPILGAIGVLIFIHQQITQTVLPALSHLGVFLEQAHRQRDQVVEIHRLVGAQGAFVFPVELGGDRGDLVVGELRRLVGADHCVLPRRDLPLHLLGDALVAFAGDVGHDLHCVRGVEDGELRLEPAMRGFLADDAHTQGMKGAQGQPAGRASAHDVGDTLLHFLRGLVGEGDGGDVVGAEPAFVDQVRDLVRDHPRLAATGPRQHQARAVKIADGFALGRVEKGRHRCGHTKTKPPGRVADFDSSRSQPAPGTFAACAGHTACMAAVPPGDKAQTLTHNRCA